MPSVLMDLHIFHTHKAGVVFILSKKKFYMKELGLLSSSEPEGINCRVITIDILYILKGTSIHIIRKNLWHNRMLSSFMLFPLEREVTFGYLNHLKSLAELMRCGVSTLILQIRSDVSQRAPSHRWQPFSRLERKVPTRINSLLYHLSWLKAPETLLAVIRKVAITISLQWCHVWIYAQCCLLRVSKILTLITPILHFNIFWNFEV